jgi:hypothetical protein
VRHFGGTFDIIARARGHLVEEDLFSDAAGHEDGKARVEVLLIVR